MIELIVRFGLGLGLHLRFRVLVAPVATAKVPKIPLLILFLGGLSFHF